MHTSSTKRNYYRLLVSELEFHWLFCVSLPLDFPTSTTSPVSTEWHQPPSTQCNQAFKITRIGKARKDTIQLAWCALKITRSRETRKDTIQLSLGSLKTSRSGKARKDTVQLKSCSSIHALLAADEANCHETNDALGKSHTFIGQARKDAIQLECCAKKITRVGKARKDTIQLSSGSIRALLSADAECTSIRLTRLC